MGWFSKRNRERTQKRTNATRDDGSPTTGPHQKAGEAALQPGTRAYTEVDEVIATAEGLPAGADRVIQRDFDYASTRWGCEEIPVLDRVAVRELLHKTVIDGLPRGFGRLSVVSDVEGGLSYAQLNATDGRTFRPYRIVKREDDQLALYGHQAQTAHTSPSEAPTKASTTPWRPKSEIANSIVLYRPLQGINGVEIRLHETILYASLYRADNDVLVNPHAYGVTASHAPVLHVRHIDRDDMASTYLDSFEQVWRSARPLTSS